MSATLDADTKLWTYHQLANTALLARSHPRQNMIFKTVRRLVKPGGKVLEIGFGDGFLLGQLCRYYQCCAADISQENIDQIKAQVPKVEYKLVTTDGTLPYKNNTLDGYIASEVFEHMSDQKVEVSVKEIKRILKPGGYAVITTPALENLQLNDCICPDCSTTFHRWGHKQYWDEPKVRETFSSLEMVRIRRYFNRFVGTTWIENAIGYILYYARTFLDRFIRVEGAVYVIVLRKQEK